MSRPYCGTCGRHLPGAYDDRLIPGMIELNEAVHKHGCLTIGQLHHIGPSAGSTPDGLPPISSSTLSEDEMPVPKPWCQAPRGLTVEEIHEKQRLQIEAAVRLQKGGFDAVEVHVAHGYFLDSFVSPLWNKRDDEYVARTSRTARASCARSSKASARRAAPTSSSAAV